MASEQFLNQAREEVDERRGEIADEWRGKREKGKTVIQMTREAQSDYYRMLQAERGIEPLKRKSKPQFLVKPPQHGKGQDSNSKQGIIKERDPARIKP